MLLGESGKINPWAVLRASLAVPTANWEHEISFNTPTDLNPSIPSFCFYTPFLYLSLFHLLVSLFLSLLSSLTFSVSLSLCLSSSLWAGASCLPASVKACSECEPLWPSRFHSQQLLASISLPRGTWIDFHLLRSTINFPMHLRISLTPTSLFTPA